MGAGCCRPEEEKKEKTKMQHFLDINHHKNQYLRRGGVQHIGLKICPPHKSPWQIKHTHMLYDCATIYEKTTFFLPWFASLYDTGN